MCTDKTKYPPHSVQRLAPAGGWARGAARAAAATRLWRSKGVPAARAPSALRGGGGPAAAAAVAAAARRRSPSPADGTRGCAERGSLDEVERGSPPRRGPERSWICAPTG